MKVYGIIMAGGDGTRFWPLSRKATPKQLLNLSGKEVILNETIDRLMPAVTREIFIVTNSAQAENLKKIVSGRVPENHVLVEPAARNTSACIGLAAIQVKKKYGDAVMVITPADSYIHDNEEYARVLNTAVSYAEQTGKLVTVGIKPTFAATGYGYIKYKESDDEAKPVVRFVEKPDAEHAEQFLKSGDYLWNSGIFVWKVSTILKKFRELLPDIYEELLKISDAFSTDERERVLNAVYPKIRSVSVDYGIMEHSEGILVVPGDFGWHDIGSLDMIGVLHDSDENGNVVVGDAVQVNSHDCVIYSKNKLVVTLDVDDLIVVESPDVTLVCPKSKAQEVKKIVEELRKRGREEVL